MRVSDLFETIKTSGIFYHGTNSTFDDFDIAAEKVNRGTNVAGAYFTPREHEAEDYGERVITAKIVTKNPFYFSQKNDIPPEMQEKAKELLLRFTNYKEHWLDSVIVPRFVENGNFNNMSDVSGEIKREILLSGGYDSYVDGDHVVVLDPSKENIKVIDQG